MFRRLRSLFVSINATFLSQPRSCTASASAMGNLSKPIAVCRADGYTAGTCLFAYSVLVAVLAGGARPPHIPGLWISTCLPHWALCSLSGTTTVV